MKYIPHDERAGGPTLELTRRNLTVLLAKLDDVGSARTILDPDRVLYVRAVEDEEHYRDRAPGEMLVRGEMV